MAKNKKIKAITKEQVEEYFKKNFYISNELLTYYTVMAINLMKEDKVRVGQDIYTTTLDGPAGAGKSMYAKLYAQMVHELLGVDVSFIKYQCDESTSKIELFEDINVGAAVAGESNKVNIPGVIARAIQEANKGRKVVLFIDEYDKTREQIDSLFLQMLQDGVINTNQFGDLEIDDKNKGSIQVIFCKNDFRTELTDPITRRMRMVYLDIMKPADFKNLAMRILYNETTDKQELTIINLVSLLYEEIYKHRGEYRRVCAVSELYQAIQDLTYLSRIEAPNYILYETLIDDLFKSRSDREIFELQIASITSETLKNILVSLKQDKPQEQEASIIDIISEEIKKQAQLDAQKVLVEEQEKLKKGQEKVERQLAELKLKEDALEKRKAELTTKMEAYLKEVEEKFNALIEKKAKEAPLGPPSPLLSPYALNFSDNLSLIKRGRNITESMKDPVMVATCIITQNDLKVEELVNAFLNQNAIVYENGFLITEPYKIMIVRTEPDNDNKITFKFFMEQAYLSEDSKKEDETQGAYIKNYITKIISLILALNNSPLHEVNFETLGKIYSREFGFGFINDEAEISRRVLVKYQELPF